MNGMGKWCDPEYGEKAFNVSYIRWNTFYDAVIDPDQHCDTMEIITNANCVIGGIDVSTPYM